MQNEKIKKFIEPELIKCEKRLDEVTMEYNQYNDNGPSCVPA